MLTQSRKKNWPLREWTTVSGEMTLHSKQIVKSDGDCLPLDSFHWIPNCMMQLLACYFSKSYKPCKTLLMLFNLRQRQSQSTPYVLNKVLFHQGCCDGLVFRYVCVSPDRNNSLMFNIGVGELWHWVNFHVNHYLCKGKKQESAGVTIPVSAMRWQRSLLF